MALPDWCPRQMAMGPRLVAKLQPHEKSLRKFSRALPASEYRVLVSWLSVLFPFQVNWMLDDAAYAACVKSRQIGFSHTTAAWGVLRAAFFGELTTVISVGQLEANEVIEKCRGHFELLEALGSNMATRTANNKTEIHTASGGRIIALPSSGGRSFTGNVFLDEFAYMQHPEEVWDAAMAVTMHSGLKARVASTPNGVGNPYHHLITDGAANDGWSIHSVSIHDAIAQGMKVDIKKCWAMAKNDPRIFAQLFECAFLDNDAQYIPSAMVYGVDAQYEQGAEPGKLGHPVKRYAGLDIGLNRDRTTLVIVEHWGGTFWPMHIESHAKTDDQLLDELVARAFGTFAVQRLTADATGLGSMPAQRLARRWGVRFEPLVFTSSSKEELATGLYDVFSQGKIKLPKTWSDGPGKPDLAKQLKIDLCSIKRLVTAAGNVRYDAQRTEQGHADLAWSLAMAVMAGSRPTAARGVGTLSLGY